jgi:hypothetical protein
MSSRTPLPTFIKLFEAFLETIFQRLCQRPSFLQRLARCSQIIVLSEYVLVKERRKSQAVTSPGNMADAQKPSHLIDEVLCDRQ